MSIIPEGEQLRKAVRWISEQRVERQDAVIFRLVEEACLKFDLPPKDEVFLINFFADKGIGNSV